MYQRLYEKYFLKSEGLSQEYVNHYQARLLIPMPLDNAKLKICVKKFDMLPAVDIYVLTARFS